MNPLELKITCQGFTTVELDELNDLQGNLKDLSEEGYVKLRNSMIEYGFSFPVFYWQDETGKKWIVDAHQRKRVLLKMREEGITIPPLPADSIHAKDRVEAKKKLLLHESHYGKLTQEGYDEFLAEEGFEINLGEIDDLLDLPDIFQEEKESNVIEDEAPEVSKEPALSKLGEVYQLGRHRLMCGDTTKIEDVEKLMDGQKANVGITDPPYGVREKEEWDDKQNFLESFGDWMVNLYEYTELGFLWFCAGSMVPFIFKVADQNKIALDRLLVWNKPAGSQYAGASHNNLWYSMEPILVFGKEGLTKNLEENEDFGYSIFESRTVPQAENGHPTSKPIDLMSWLIKHYSKKDQIILDLFGGSGSTLIACEQTNRTCYMMELDPKYCDVIRKRYAKFIGKESEWEATTPCIA